MVRQPDAYQADATDLLYRDECDNGETYGGESPVIAQLTAPVPQPPPAVQLPQTPHALTRRRRNRRPPARFSYFMFLTVREGAVNSIIRMWH